MLFVGFWQLNLEMLCAKCALVPPKMANFYHSTFNCTFYLSTQNGGAHWPNGQHTWSQVERWWVRSPVGSADFLRRTSLGPPAIIYCLLFISSGFPIGRDACKGSPWGKHSHAKSKKYYGQMRKVSISSCYGQINIQLADYNVIIELRSLLACPK